MSIVIEIKSKSEINTFTFFKDRLILAQHNPKGTTIRHIYYGLISEIKITGKAEQYLGVLKIKTGSKHVKSHTSYFELTEGTKPKFEKLIKEVKERIDSAEGESKDD